MPGCGFARLSHGTCSTAKPGRCRAFASRRRALNGRSRPAAPELGVVRRSSRHPRKQPYMTNSEANVTSSPSGYQSLALRASVGKAGASTLAACRTSFESSALLGFGHAATLAAMGRFVPVCASLSRSAAQLRSTSPVRESVRLAGSFLPTPQPPSAALPSAEQHRLPLAAARSAERGSYFHAPFRSHAPTLAQVRRNA